MKNVIKFIPGLVIMAVFYTLAIVLWKVKNYPLFLANFSIMGTLLGLGFGIWALAKNERKDGIRKITMVLVGSYIFLGFGLGLIYPFFGYIRTENFQIEGFWFYLLVGGFAGTVYHYSIAKIIGPFLFGRSFCAWGCWTAAVLEFLPWKKSEGRIHKGWEYFRYVFFFGNIALVLILLFAFGYVGLDMMRVKYGVLPDMRTVFFKYASMKEFWWFLAGNTAYYFIAVLLAFFLKDNRAFCKYVCPITVFMKIGTPFSLLKIKGNKEKCAQCSLCERACMMDNKITEYTKAGKRVSSSECIQCRNCVRACPNGALRLTFGLDAGFKDMIRRKNGQT